MLRLSIAPARLRLSVVALVTAAATVTSVASVPTFAAADTVPPASTWVARPSASQPPSLDGVSLARDENFGNVVLFGGSPDYDTASAETWTWSATGVAAVQWTREFPTTSPPARHDAGMAYDAARLRTILFGGRTANGTVLGDTWEWNGVNWTELHPAVSPPARSDMGFAYDAVRQRIVLFGGDTTNGTALGDTWTWDGTTWSPVTGGTAPSPRVAPAMAYDPSTESTVLFGGFDAEPGDLADTWTWNGSGWAHLSPATAPSGAEWHSLAYDQPVDWADGRLIMLGTDGTWSWDGINWTKHASTNDPVFATIVSGDVIGGHTVLAYAARDSDRTWTYRSTAEESGTASAVAPLTIPLTENYERPDRVSARIAARLTGHPVEVTSERTETTTTYVNADGSETQDLYASPIRVLVDGGWVAVDTTLESDGDVVRPRAVAADVTFSAGGTGSAASLVSDGRVFALNWPTALPTPILVGATATYPEVAPGTDLILEATSIGFEQSLRVRHRPTAPVTYRFPLTLDGFNLVQTVAGDLHLTDSVSGDLVAAGGAPLMWGTGFDVHTAEPLRSSLVQTSIVQVGSVKELRLTPDPVFLADPTVVYPVTIDPASNLTRAADTFIDTGYSSNQTSSGELKAGTYTSGQAARTLMTFSTSALAGKHILASNLKLYNFHSYSCTKKPVSAHQITSAWNPSTVTWSSGAPSVGAAANTQTVANGYSGCGANWVTWDIRSMTQAWANGTPNYGVSIRASESDTLGWKKFCSGETGSSSCPSTSYAPKLSVTYNSYPSTPSSPLPASASYSNLANVPLSAVVKDPDGGSVRGFFTVKTPSGSVYSDGSGSAVTSGSRSTYWHNVQFSGDGTYQWRVRAYDGTDTSGYLPSASTWYSFIVDRTLPAAPVVSSSTFPANAWTTSTSGTFTWTEASTDVTSYLYGIDTPIPTTSTTTRSTPTLSPGAGAHVFYVRAKDRAGNLSPVTSYSFGIGVGNLTTPRDEDRTQASTTLTSDAPAAKSHVSYWYRTGTSGTFTQIPAARVTYPGTATNPAWPVPRDPDGTFPALTWNVADTVANDGLLQVEACFHVSATDTSPACSPANDLQLAEHAFGASYATQTFGPGRLSLLTGDYSVTATDVSVPSYQGTLALGRTLTTLAPAASGIFGPGWVPDLPGPEAGAADLEVDDRTSTAGYVELTGPDGASAVFVKNAGSTYPYTYTALGDPGADGSVLTKDSATQLTLKEADGTTTVWTYRTFTNAAARWVVDHVTESASASTSSYTFDAATGRITQILGPVPAGVTCGSGLVAGCRALLVNYAPSTTATGTDVTGFGDYAGQVSSVDFRSYDPVTAAMKTVRVATYRYDSTARLRQEWDPRFGATAASGLAVTYTYGTDGRLASLTQAGIAPWTFRYDAAGRLTAVTRTSGVTSLTETVAYGVPFTGSGAPVDVGATAAATWGQTDLAATGTAIFRADHVPAGTPTASDYEYATIHYLDVNGREVNTATYAGVATTEYDQHGNVVRALSANNRSESVSPSGLDPVAWELSDSRARAAVFDTDNVYSADGTMLVDTFGPAHAVVLDDGTPVTARLHTHYDYDQGAPAGGPYRLVTTTTTSASVDTTTGRVDYDSTVVTTGYDPVVAGDASGWALRKATNTHTQMGGANPDIVRITRYDAEGRIVETRMPKAAGGTDAHTEVTTYYTVAANATFPACGGQPGLAGLVCRVGPAAQPATGPNLPVRTFTYDQFDQVLAAIETVGSTVRTATTTYDAAGRQLTQAVTVSPAASGGLALPVQSFGYDPATGLPTTTSTTVGATTTTLTKGYDAFGRVATVTDADGATTTTTYNADGKPVTVNDGKRTTTYTYDLARDRRGLLTSVDAGFTSGTPASFQAYYDADGQLAEQAYPNNLRAVWRRDAAGAVRSLVYRPGGTSGGEDWLTFTQTTDAAGNVRLATSEGSAQEYTYDAAGRMSRVADVSGTDSDLVCATRTYAYDLDSNRTSQAETVDLGEGCATAGTPTTTNHTYDDADRLADAGYVYDALGRTTGVPGATALTVGYYANDVVASQSLAGGRSMSWVLDPARRLRSWADSAGGLTRVNHYGGDGDSPSWIGVSDGTWTRNVAGIDGNLAAIETLGLDGVATVDLQLTNPHGDVVATVADVTDAIAIDRYFESTEFGAPRASNPVTPRYGWLGGKQRSADALGGVVLMGVRLYAHGLGRFLQTDPVPGGSANAYDYANQDPSNQSDLDGRMATGGGGGDDRGWMYRRCGPVNWSCHDTWRGVKPGTSAPHGLPRCGWGVKGASQFLGWRFAFTSLDQFRKGHYRKSGQALVGGWGSGATKGAAVGGKWYYGGGMFLRGGARLGYGLTRFAAKIGSAPVGIVATVADYGCR